MVLNARSYAETKEFFGCTGIQGNLVLCHKTVCSISESLELLQNNWSQLAMYLKRRLSHEVNFLNSSAKTDLLLQYTVPEASFHVEKVSCLYSPSMDIDTCNSCHRPDTAYCQIVHYSRKCTAPVGKLSPYGAGLLETEWNLP
jgi:hypothetical protein